jgi:glutaredoxin
VTRLTLYSRNYCHLCHDMQAALEALRPEFIFDLEIVDIDTNPVLEARYDDLVPVLMHQERELARYRVDLEAVRAYLTETR